MRKAPLLAIAIASLGILSLDANAQSTEVPSTQMPPATAQALQETSKQQITVEELPDGIKKALKSNILKEWQVSEIYRVSPVAQDTLTKPTYEVLFRNAEQKRAIAHFDEEGKAIASQE